MLKPSNNILFVGSVIAVFALGIVGCAAPGSSGSVNVRGEKNYQKFPKNNSESEMAGLDFGAEWERKLGQAGGRQPWIGEGVNSPRRWTIVLNTFTAHNHAQAATNMIQQVQQITPQVGDMRVETTQNGSMVVHGRYAGPGESAATMELKRIKEIKYHKRAIFGGAMLTRLAGAKPRSLHPHDLRMVRRTHPGVNQIYTLNVAVWGDFDSGQWPAERIHRAAEAQVRELRSRGFEAYFHHDDEKLLSDVTVGVFGAKAIDPQSGVMSMEVLELMKKFPYRLVNGQPLETPVNPRRPADGTVKQASMLVEVPKE